MAGLAHTDDQEFSLNELRMFKTGCLESLLFCARIFFKRRDSVRFIVSAHHVIMCHILDQVYSGKIKRLIINIPPGYTKTELAVIFFILKGLLINARAKFFHTSYSGDLALVNSGIIKDLIVDPLFQAMQPMDLRVDTKAKARWYTKQGGGMMAAAQGGQVTGFRAGRMEKDEFTGAMIIDDPIKPEDAFSKQVRERVNRTFNTTISTRLATQDVPIIVIMQRTHDDDLSGFLLKGGSKETWHHLEIPAYVSKVPAPYPKEWTHGKRVPYDLPAGPLWHHKHSYDELKIVKSANSYVWNCQFKQRPTSIGGTVFHRDWFTYYTSYDPLMCEVTLSDGSKVKIKYINSYSDTALKPEDRNDWTVFQTWGLGSDGRIYLLGRIRGKWDSVDLEKKYVRYLKRLKFVPQVNNMGPREIGVEDKASGIGLIQSINRKIGTNHHTDDRGNKIDLTGLPKITPIPRGAGQNKVPRALSSAPHVERGEVVLPEFAPWVEEFLDEVCTFSVDMTHSHDDQCDPMFDACHRMLIAGMTVDYGQLVGLNK